MNTFFEGKTIVISGISRGIGKAIALQAAALNMNVAGFDIRENDLLELQNDLTKLNVHHFIQQVDITDNKACKKFIDDCKNRFNQIDILINNAGITHIAPESETSPHETAQLMHVNVLGLMTLSHYALPHIIEQKGSLVSLSSVAGYSPLLYRTTYAASKHAVWGYMSSLRTEIRDKKVQVLTVCPSFVKTDLQENQQQYFSNQTSEELMPSFVSNEIFKAIFTKKELALIGKTAKRVYWINRFFPKLYEKIMISKTKA